MSDSSSQRMLSLWLRRLSTDRIARSREKSPELSAPLVVTGKRGNAEVLTAVDEAAERLGLSPGLALAQARAMHPDIEAVPEDTEADAVLLETIADWCLRYTPLVACDTPDGLLLDISGCAHLYGGEHALVADLGSRLEEAGFAYRSPLPAPSAPPGPPRITASRQAMPAARNVRYSRHCRCPRCGFRRHRRGSCPRRLEAHRRYRRSAARPLTARFGSEVLRQLDRALGHEHEPLNPRLPVAPYVAEQRFAEPIAREEDVLAITERLARRLQFALERRGDGARRIELTLFRTDGGCAASPPAPRGRCAIRTKSARCSSSGSPRSPMHSIPASASTWRGCRSWLPSPPARTDRHRRRRGRGRARPPGRSSERAAGRAPRAPADRAGQPYSRNRRGRVPAQAVMPMPAGMRSAITARRPSLRRVRCGC